MSKYLDPNFTIRENKRLIGYTNYGTVPHGFVSYEAVTNNSGKVESLDDFTAQKVYTNKIVLTYLEKNQALYLYKNGEIKRELQNNEKENLNE